MQAEEALTGFHVVAPYRSGYYHHREVRADAAGSDSEVLSEEERAGLEGRVFGIVQRRNAELPSDCMELSYRIDRIPLPCFLELLEPVTGFSIRQPRADHYVRWAADRHRRT